MAKKDEKTNVVNEDKATKTADEIIQEMPVVPKNPREAFEIATAQAVAPPRPIDLANACCVTCPRYEDGLCKLLPKHEAKNPGDWCAQHPESGARFKIRKEEDSQARKKQGFAEASARAGEDA